MVSMGRLLVVRCLHFWSTIGRLSSDYCRSFGPGERPSLTTDLSSSIYIVRLSSDSWPTECGLLTVLHCIFFAAGNKSSS